MIRASSLPYDPAYRFGACHLPTTHLRPSVEASTNVYLCDLTRSGNFQFWVGA